MSELQRRAFHEALLDARSSGLPGQRQAAILRAEGNRPNLQILDRGLAGNVARVVPVAVLLGSGRPAVNDKFALFLLSELASLADRVVLAVVVERTSRPPTSSAHSSPCGDYLHFWHRNLLQAG